MTASLDLTHRRPRAAVLSLVAATAVFVSACSPAGEAQPEDPSQPTITTTSTADAPTPEESSSEEATSEAPTSDITPDETSNSVDGAQPLGDPTLDLKTQEAEGDYDLAVTDIRSGSHGNFDRVVFEFTGDSKPGWRIDYTDEPRQQASGFPIEYEGGTALSVLIYGTPYPMELGIEDSEVPQIGPVAGESGNVTGVSHNSIFEAISQYVIGVEEQAPYSVTLLENPTRLVVDVVQP